MQVVAGFQRNGTRRCEGASSRARPIDERFEGRARERNMERLQALQHAARLSDLQGCGRGGIAHEGVCELMGPLIECASAGDSEFEKTDATEVLDGRPEAGVEDAQAVDGAHGGFADRWGAWKRGLNDGMITRELRIADGGLRIVEAL